MLPHLNLGSVMNIQASLGRASICFLLNDGVGASVPSSEKKKISSPPEEWLPEV